MRNAFNDVSRSIAALPDSFSKLAYLASLRDRDGRYRHWGLTQEYGEERTGAAYQQVHRAAFESLLRISFSDLSGTLKDHCALTGRNFQEIIDEFSRQSAVTPSGVEEHSAMHFKYVLASLLALSQASY